MNNFAALVLAVALALPLAGCGTKGMLVLPPGPAPEPLLGHLNPVKPTLQQPGSADGSMDPKARTQ